MIGRRFDRAILGEVSECDPTALEQALDALIAGRLLREPPGGSGELEFRHDLTARVAYELIQPSRRARLHGLAARAFDAAGMELPEAVNAARYHRARSRPANRKWLWAAGIAAVLAAVGIVLIRRPSHAAVGAGRVVVASFENRTRR